MSGSGQRGRLVEKADLKWDDIIQCKKGIVLDSSVFVTVQNKDVREAAHEIYSRIKTKKQDLEKRRKEKLVRFYIGKTYVPEIGSELKSENMKGLRQRYSTHIKKRYGRSGMIVFAHITEESIPLDCKRSWYLLTPEEYVLAVERRLIQMFQGVFDTGEKVFKDERIDNPSVDSGALSQNQSRPQGIYMAFTMECKIATAVIGAWPYGMVIVLPRLIVSSSSCISFGP